MKYLAMLLLCCGFALSQNAKVIALTPADAAKAKELHEAALNAQKAVADFDKLIRERYTDAKPDAKGDLYMSSTKVGWEAGVEYSDDWLFIVPKAFPPNSAGSLVVQNPWPWSTTVTPTPYLTCFPCGGATAPTIR